MDRIIRMCKQTNRKDITFAFTSISLAVHGYAGQKLKFGEGWMGKNAEIRGVDSKGIIVSITISDNTVIHKCCLKSPEDEIHLGEPTDTSYS